MATSAGSKRGHTINGLRVLRVKLNASFQRIIIVKCPNDNKILMSNFYSL